MITREQIPAVLDHPVYDAEGNKVGEAKHVFLDDATGMPEWATVKTGLLGTSESFVPIRDASIVEDHLEVPYPKNTIKDAPHVDVDAGGHLSVDEEHRLYEYYGIRWDDAWQQANEPGEGGWAHEGAGGGTAGAAGMAAGTAGMAGTAGDETTRRRGVADDETARMRGAGGGVGRDDAMTRSEEQLRVGVDRQETGRARLRKYVVTEEVQQTVPVKREEVRVEREPITDANRDAAMSGPEISEAEHEVVLHEERPVAQTETVPVERVRMTTEEHADQETVRGQVRKERIDVEGVEKEEGPGK
ncbi:PRC and DUF2382 domain-containing protein [Streptomyces sp. NPDC006610]|uniref:PRC and DUF2382 domain-containing protein n=1 Tax=Streptomyces sp. NPDC006610 TaxID=3154584 RepID=UPI0033B38149